MNKYLKIIDFCLNTKRKTYTIKTFNDVQIIVPDDIFHKKILKKEELIKILITKIKTENNSEYLILHFCEKYPNQSAIILNSFHSNFIIQHIFNFILEEQSSPAILCSDFNNIYQFIDSIIYGKPKNTNPNITSYYSILINLLRNYNFINIHLKDLLFLNSINFINNILLNLHKLDKNNNPSQLHLFFPYHLISLFISNFNEIYWKKIVAWIVQNNLWKILNNIDILFLENNLPNRKIFHYCILQNISFNRNAIFTFLAEDVITINVNSCITKGLKIFDNISKSFPDKKDFIFNLKNFYDKNEFDLKIYGINNYYYKCPRNSFSNTAKTSSKITQISSKPAKYSKLTLPFSIKSL